MKYKIVEENWIEKSLALFDARIWLQYDKNGEHATNLRCKVCTQFREHIEGIQYFKEDWITASTNHCSSNAIDHAEGVPHKEAMNIITNHLERHMMKKEIIISNP